MRTKIKSKRNGIIRVIIIIMKYEEKYTQKRR